MLTRHRTRGFTIIELAVALTIAGVLLALGAPAFGTFLQNARLGTRAKSYYTGIQLARSEAVRLNLPVEFVLTDTPINTANLENVAASSPAGRNWLVRYQAAPASGPYLLVEAKSAGEGGDMNSLLVLASNDGIVFNGLGGTTSAAQLEIKSPAGCAATGGPMRCWQINVSPNGQVRLCDPAVASGSGDSRAC